MSTVGSPMPKPMPMAIWSERLKAPELDASADGKADDVSVGEAIPVDGPRFGFDVAMLLLREAEDLVGNGVVVAVSPGE